jgi:hypothetical protein
MNNITMIFLITMLTCLDAHARDFCDNAELFKLNHVINNKSEFLNKRIRTQAIMITNAKEFTLIKQDEIDKIGILVTSDEVSSSYRLDHNIPVDKSFNVTGDYFEKMKSRSGSSVNGSLSEIYLYRQKRMLCGRLINKYNKYYFSIDDSILEQSYILNK